MPGQTRVPEGIRGPPSLCHRRASAPATRNRFLVSPVSPPVRPVSRRRRHQRLGPLPSHRRRSPPAGDGHARWTPRSLSAPIRTATIAAGWAGAISVRMVIRAGGLWRQLYCSQGEGYCLETCGTPLHGKRVAPEKRVWAVGTLAEGLGLRAVARVFAVDPNTVLAWLVEVAEHAAAFSQYFLPDVRVTQVQLDELFALLRAVKTGEVSEAVAIARLSRSPHWVWAAIDPVTK